MRAFCISAPLTEPLTLDDAKAWLRLDTSQDDDLVANLIRASRLVVEQHTRRLLVTQTWRLQFDTWPAGPLISIPLAPVQAIVALRVLDGSGVWQTVSPSLYVADVEPDAARVRTLGPLPPSAVTAGGVAIDVRVGYGAASDVPEPIRQALRQTVAWLYENRGDAPAGVPVGVRALLAPFCRPRLA